MLAPMLCTCQAFSLHCDYHMKNTPCSVKLNILPYCMVLCGLVTISCLVTSHRAYHLALELMGMLRFDGGERDLLLKLLFSLARVSDGWICSKWCEVVKVINFPQF